MKMAEFLLLEVSPFTLNILTFITSVAMTTSLHTFFPNNFYT